MNPGIHRALSPLRNAARPGPWIAAGVSLGVLLFSARAPAECSPLDLWYVRGNVPSSAVYGIEFGNGIFVAGGNGANWTSPDGHRWTIRSNLGTEFAAIAFGHGRFVASCWRGGLLSSTNGVDWTQLQPVPPIQLVDVTFAEGRFVAVGYGGPSTYKHYIYTSPDGLEWMVQTFEAGGGTSFNALWGVAYGNGMFVALGTAGFPSAAVLYTSPDATNWTSRSLGFPLAPYHIAYGNGVFVATRPYQELVLRSTNGLDWTVHTTAPQVLLYDIIFAENQFVATSIYGYMHFSPDGLTWTTRGMNALSGRQLLGVAYGHGRFTAVGEDFVQSGSFVPALPIVLQPPQDRVLKVGRAYTNRVAADAGCLARYQWRLSGANLPGETNTVLVVTNAPLSLSGEHTVVVANEAGAVTSAVARVLVVEPCAITAHPVSQRVVRGSNAVFSVAVSGTPPMFYRWRRLGGLMPRYVESQENTDFLIVTNVQTNAVYSVVVSNLVNTPGVLSLDATLTVLEDSDGDGLPDEFEAANGLGTNNAADALTDSDDDGLSNAEEYIAGTDPRDPDSRLEVSRISREGGARLEFPVQPGRTYTVQYTEDLAVGVWIKLKDVPARTSAATEVIIDPLPPAHRYYRLATPRQE